MSGIPKSKVDHEVLSMALVEYEAEREKIIGRIGEIRGLLDGTSATVEEEAPVRKRRKMSAAARENGCSDSQIRQVHEMLIAGNDATIELALPDVFGG